MTIAATSAPAQSSLGTTAKSLHKKRGKPLNRTPLESRGIRFKLQRQAQNLLFDRSALKQHRVCNCCRNWTSDIGGIDIYATIDGTDARYAGLQTCGSVWGCPVCSAKITEKRRAELQRGINNWQAQGGSVLLMTLTFPHEYEMELGDMLERFQNALTKFKNSRAYKSTFGTATAPGEYERAGSVRSLEVTYGINGWHPHTHDLVFVRRSGLDSDHRRIDGLKAEWLNQLLKAGFGDSTKINDMWERGLDIQAGDKAGEYVAKFGHESLEWGAAREVTKGISKIGGGEHATPFQLLVWSYDGDVKAGQLFKEFLQHFEGKRMLSWSPGLKKLLGVVELTDEEIAADDAAKPMEIKIISLDEEDWRLILSRDARLYILQAAASGGANAVREKLLELETRPPTFSGNYAIQRDFAWRDYQGRTDTSFGSALRAMASIH